LGLGISCRNNHHLAQCTDYKWPQDVAKAEKQVESFRSAMKEQNYKRQQAASIGC